MDRTAPPLVTIAICLAGLAGFVDALAFTSFGGFFASFMSGNSTRLGVGLGGGGLGQAVVAVSLVMSFVGGVILASVIVRARPAHHMQTIMAAVTVALLIAALLGTVAPGPIALLLLAAAMGCMNGIFHRGGEVSIGVTYMTGSLVRLGQKAAGTLMGDADRWGWVPYLALWLGFVCGVVLGTAAHMKWDWDAMWLAPVAAAVLTVMLARASRPSPAKAG
jgi:uncharacterized membrane protein YoaK (UPF0700 family)